MNKTLTGKVFDAIAKTEGDKQQCVKNYVELDNGKIVITFPKSSQSKSYEQYGIWPGVMTGTDSENGGKCTCATLEYKFKFNSPKDPSTEEDNSNFPLPWIKGGKLPGLRGGCNVTGGNAPKAKEGCGFSVRPMWRANGVIEIYAYFLEMFDVKFGDRLCSSAVDTLEVDTDYQLKLQVDLGTVQEKGQVRLTVTKVGSSRACYDCALDLQFLKNGKKLTVEKIQISAFYGGDDSSWGPYSNQILELWDFENSCTSDS